MFDWITKLFRGPTIIDEKEMTEALFTKIQRGCPSCHCPPNWREGPHGGICTNIYCGDCGEGYNIAPIVGVAQKIGKDERYIVHEKMG
jgi:hypothetical protein